MVTLLEKELEFEKDIKKKFDIIGSFIDCKPEFINGSIKTINKTNITYVEPHRIIHKGITFLKYLTLCSSYNFNYYYYIFIMSLRKPLFFFLKLELTRFRSYDKKLF